MMKISHLGDGDAYVRFFFNLGDEVAWRMDDGTPDPEMHGVIIGGTCEYQEGGGGWYTEEYEVKRSDGLFFRERSLGLIKRGPLTSP